MNVDDRFDLKSLPLPVVPSDIMFVMVDDKLSAQSAWDQTLQYMEQLEHRLLDRELPQPNHTVINK